MDQRQLILVWHFNLCLICIHYYQGGVMGVFWELDMDKLMAVISQQYVGQMKC